VTRVVCVATLRRGALAEPELVDRLTAYHVLELRRVRTLVAQAERDPEISILEMRRLQDWSAA
jgi:hypothetical protein